MIEPTERHSSVSAMYITWVLLFVVAMSCLPFLMAVGLYWGLYGTPNLSEVATIKIPEYSRAAMWKGRVWYPVMNIGPSMPPGALMSFDPEQGETSELKVPIRSPGAGLLGQGDRLWIVSSNSVIMIEGDETKEFSPQQALVQASSPFLYEDQLAVIDVGTAGQPTLFVFQNDDWVNLGTVVIPFQFPHATVDGKNVWASDRPRATGRVPLMEIQVASQDGSPHLFVSDGILIAYRKGIELTPVSALAPENVDDEVDLSNLLEWEIAVLRPASSGARVKNVWKGGFLKSEPVVLALSAADPNQLKNIPIQNQFKNIAIQGHCRAQGIWKKMAETSLPALLEWFAVSDGQRTYFAGQSLFGQILRVHRFDGDSMPTTGVVIKPPAARFQSIMEQWARLMQWVYWPSLLIFVLGISCLMKAYRTAEYQFGLTTVELASFTRRAIARVLDYFVYVAAFYLIALAFGMSSQEQVQQDIDRLFSFGPEGLLLRFLWMMLSLVICSLIIVIVNSVLQGGWGVTLGKWLCGIRTVRSTLRPCGFARALVRELLLLVDTLLAISYLPGTLMFAFTSCRQRIGDLVADTIVIRKATTTTDPDVNSSLDLFLENKHEVRLS